MAKKDTTKPLVDKKFLLEKFPGKGGWTYAIIPEIAMDKNAPFGWVRVKGFVDSFEISKYHLMPIGNGRLFLPVKGEIRKKIKKQEGDWVHIVLYADFDPIVIPDELLLCMQDEPESLRFFNTLTDGQQQAYIKWMEDAKTMDTKVNRIAKIVDNLLKGIKYHNTVNPE